METPTNPILDKKKLLRHSRRTQMMPYNRMHRKMFIWSFEPVPHISIFLIRLFSQRIPTNRDIYLTTKKRLWFFYSDIVFFWVSALSYCLYPFENKQKDVKQSHFTIPYDCRQVFLHRFVLYISCVWFLFVYYLFTCSRSYKYIHF